MDNSNRPADLPNEYTPLFSIPRNAPSDIEYGDLADRESTTNSDLSSYDICDGTDCVCATSHPPRLSPHLTPHSFTPELAQSHESNVTAGNSTDPGASAMYRILHVASYDMEYATWRALEGTLERWRRTDNNDSEDDDAGCWPLCWPRWLTNFFPSKPSTPHSTIGDGETNGDGAAAAEQMASPSQEHDGGASNTTESPSLNITCSVSRYAIKFPARQDQRSDTTPQRRVVIVESGPEEEEETEA
ncbi:hypothetical protein EDB80DRAFT_877799 [Ilyonectria destructans]|nr:hypothetical protein EDB80DRAFT_877799 [Ilyonectria destructans]